MARKKRSKDQVVHDRARVAELKLQQYTDNEIAKILAKETGLVLSRRQITYDMGKVRKSWLEKQQASYAMHVAIELARIDALEREIWVALRASTKHSWRETIDKIVSNPSMPDELTVAKVQKMTESSSANPAYFAQIMACHTERRKLLGLYAPQHSIVEKRVIKAYATVSPGDWPSDAIEGEYSEGD